jgi:hypothetical protein
MTDFFISKPSDRQQAHIAIDQHELPMRIKLSMGGKRSIEQNSYLWGVCYETILAHSLREQGWTREDLHEYFLGEFHGWQTLEGFGRKKVKPVERSSGKSKMEFMEYIAFIQQKAAEIGIYIPEPSE